MRLFIVLAVLASGGLAQAKPHPTYTCKEPQMSDVQQFRIGYVQELSVDYLKTTFDGAMSAPEILEMCGGHEQAMLHSLARITPVALPATEWAVDPIWGALKYRAAAREFPAMLNPEVPSGFRYAADQVDGKPLTIHYFDLGDGTAFVYFEMTV